MCLDNQIFLIFIGRTNLGQSRDVLKNHDVPYLMLTGTCTETMKETIFKQLYLSSTSVSVIAVSIDRYEYYYHAAEDIMK